jgi:hypothetical protein
MLKYSLDALCLASLFTAKGQKLLQLAISAAESKIPDPNSALIDCPVCDERMASIDLPPLAEFVVDGCYLCQENLVGWQRV